MIRAHMATFPVRREIMIQVVASIAPQVDQLFICLNQYDAIPHELATFENVTAVIPDTDLKDLGKFYFNPDPDDVVFTIDDDIIFPAHYVADTMEALRPVGLNGHVFGYMANAWVFKKQKNAYGWRNYMFFNACKDVFAVDVLGTGTAVMMGRDMPDLNAVMGAAGFVDVRFARWQKQRGNMMWTLPRVDEYLGRNLPKELEDSSLFNTVTRIGNVGLRSETRELVGLAAEYSGKPWRNVKGKL